MIETLAPVLTKPDTEDSSFDPKRYNQSLESRLNGLFSPREADVIARYFPPDTKDFDIDVLYTFLRELVIIHNQLVANIKTSVLFYTPVAALSAICNFFLVMLMSTVKYKSSSAVFLTTLAFLDFFAAVALLVEFAFVSEKNLSLYAPTDDIKRCLIDFGRVLPQFSAYWLLLLVAVDRWKNVNWVRGRLFRDHRMLKFVASLLVPLSLSVLSAYAYPPTVTIVLETNVQVFTCVYVGCRGSKLLSHSSRSWSDARSSFTKIAATVILAFVATLLLPMYIFMGSTATNKIKKQRLYEDERDDVLRKWGDLPSPFDRPKMLNLSKLPVIYEVDETDFNIETNVIFPYTLIIWHEVDRNCCLTKANNIQYHISPVPENARPVEPFVVPKSYDAEVDTWDTRFKKRQNQLTYPRRFSSVQLNKLYRPSLGDSNTNRSAVPINMTRADKMTQTEQELRFNASPTDHVCECYKQDHKHTEKTRFLTKQIIFSINCCCNRTTPIECVSEMICSTVPTSSHQLQSSAADAVSSGLMTPTYGNSKSSETVRTKTFRYTGVYFQEDKEFSLGATASAVSLVSEPPAMELCTVLATQPREHKVSTVSEVSRKIRRVQKKTPEGAEYDTAEGSTWRDWESRDMLVPSFISGKVQDLFTRKQGFSASGTDGMLGSCSNIKWNSTKTEARPANVRQSELFSSRTDTTITNKDNKNNNTELEERYQEEEEEEEEEESRNIDNMVVSRRSRSDSLSLINHNSLMIYLQVRDHFMEHSTPLSIIGVPQTLTVKENVSRALITQNVILRLMFMTLVYILLFSFPWMIELGLIQFDERLYISGYFSGLVQILSLLLFSEHFRQKCMTFCGGENERR